MNIDISLWNQKKGSELNYKGAVAIIPGHVRVWSEVLKFVKEAPVYYII